jgi:hypothetical protein
MVRLCTQHCIDRKESTDHSHNLIFISVVAYYVFSLGYAVVQLVEALLYKTEGHGFDSQWCHWNFSLT